MFLLIAVNNTKCVCAWLLIKVQAVTHNREMIWKSSVHIWFRKSFANSFQHTFSLSLLNVLKNYDNSWIHKKYQCSRLLHRLQPKKYFVLKLKHIEIKQSTIETFLTTSINFNWLNDFSRPRFLFINFAFTAIALRIAISLFYA
jgi:hypothetical protein